MFKTLMAGTAGLLLSMVVATAASAQSTAPMRDPTNRADVQCMAIMALGAGTAEEGSVAQLGLAVGMAYYLGRLEGRAPSVDWMAQFTEYLSGGDLEDEAKAQAERCGTEMISFGGRMTRWGERMQALAAKQDPGKQTRPSPPRP
jgi:hypothetical protein